MDKEVKKQRLKRVKIDNYKGAKHVDVEIRENRLFLIGGKNGAGKTSVIDAVRTLISGKKHALRPIREGADEAVIEAEFTDFKARLVINASGNIEPKLLDLESGRAVKNAKRALRDMAGEHLIEPSEFLRLAPKDKRAMLRALVLDADGKPVDMEALDAKHKEAYELRKRKREDMERAQAVLQDTPAVPDAPKELVKSDDVAKAIDEVNTHNNAIAAAKSKHDAKVSEETAAQRQVDALKKQLEEAEDNLARCSKRSKEAKAELDKLGERKDASELQQKLREVDAENDKFRAHEEHLEARQMFQDCEAAYEEAKAAVEKIERERTELLENGRFPVKGLAFTEEGTTIDGIPFEDCSRSRQEMAAIEIALANADKPLSVVLVDDGEVFDDTFVKALEDLCAEKDSQLLMCCGSRREHYDLFLENGQAK